MNRPAIWLPTLRLQGETCSYEKHTADFVLHLIKSVHPDGGQRCFGCEKHKGTVAYSLKVFNHIFQRGISGIKKESLSKNLKYNILFPVVLFINLNCFGGSCWVLKTTADISKTQQLTKQFRWLKALQERGNIILDFAVNCPFKNFSKLNTFED